MKSTRKIRSHLLRSGTITFVSLIFGSWPTASHAGQGEWTQKADMPSARFLFSTGAVKGKVYAIGGRAFAQPPSRSTVEEYDPATDTWTTKADMPTARDSLSTCVVGGTIYAIGGAIASGLQVTRVAAVEEYDPATDTWKKKANMPRARADLSTSVVGGKIYVIGGLGAAPPYFPAVVDEFDPKTSTWKQKAGMPTPRFRLSTCVVGGKIYAIGGSVACCDSQGRNPVSTVEEYDPATDIWTKRADLPTPRYSLSTSVVNGRIYAIGGSQNGAGLATVEVYDPTLNQWNTVGDMPTPKSDCPTSVVNEKIYVFGGIITDRPFSQTAGVEEYDTGFPGEGPAVNGKHVLIGMKRGFEGFELIFTGEVGRAYRLQASNDLAKGIWIDLSSKTFTQGTTTFLDTAAQNLSQRFYRVVSP